MAFTWKDSMRNVSPVAELEDATRAAVVTAIEHMTSAPADKRPRWDGGNVLVPRNDTAEKMLAAIVAPLPTEMTQATKMRLVSVAVRAAESVCKTGTTNAAALTALEERMKKPEAKSTPAK